MTNKFATLQKLVVDRFHVENKDSISVCIENAKFRGTAIPKTDSLVKKAVILRGLMIYTQLHLNFLY